MPATVQVGLGGVWNTDDDSADQASIPLHADSLPLGKACRKMFISPQQLVWKQLYNLIRARHSLELEETNVVDIHIDVLPAHTDVRSQGVKPYQQMRWQLFGSPGSLVDLL